MLTVKQLVQADVLDSPDNEIKLVRHVDHLNRSIEQIFAEGHIDFYQQEQSPKIRPFHN
jgi:alpha-glucuronidase